MFALRDTGEQRDPGDTHLVCVCEEVQLSITNTDWSKAICYPVGSSAPCVSHTPRTHWLSAGAHLRASVSVMYVCEKMIVMAAHLVLGGKYHGEGNTKDKKSNERKRGRNDHNDAIMIQFRFLHQLCKHIQKTCQILIGSSTSQTVFIKELKLNPDSLINHG